MIYFETLKNNLCSLTQMFCACVHEHVAYNVIFGFTIIMRMTRLLFHSVNGHFD